MYLIDKLNKASKIINNNNRYGSGNYIIVNPQIANMLNNINILEERRIKIKKIMKRIK